MQNIEEDRLPHPFGLWSKYLDCKHNAFGRLILYEEIEHLQEMSDAYFTIGVRRNLSHTKILTWQGSPVYLPTCEEGRDNASSLSQFLGNGHF